MRFVNSGGGAFHSLIEIYAPAHVQAASLRVRSARQGAT